MAQCIFCGSATEITKEHVWADWLKAHIPKQLLNYNAAVATEYADKPTELKVKLVAGDPHSRRVKCVCATCNNGWMSQLQQAAKPIIVPFFENREVALNEKQQKLVAGWSAMAVMCSEFGDRSRIAISQESRDILYAHQVPPRRNWRTWMGLYERDKWKARWSRHHICITSNEEEAEAFKRQTFFNTQSTTYAVGSIIFHTISSSVTPVVRDYALPHALRGKLFEIWAPQAAEIKLSPDNALSDQEAYGVATDFYNQLKAIIAGEERS